MMRLRLAELAILHLELDLVGPEILDQASGLRLGRDVSESLAATAGSGEPRGSAPPCDISSSLAIPPAPPSTPPVASDPGRSRIEAATPAASPNGGFERHAPCNALDR